MRLGDLTTLATQSLHNVAQIMKDSIIKEAMFNHPIETVWKAISQANEISTWFIQADFKPEKGYKYTFTASEEKGCLTITGEVLEASPYVLTYTWVVQDSDTITTVKWLLAPKDGQTSLQLEHSGISDYPGESAVAFFESFNGGWDDCVSQLSKYLIKEVHAA
ncbi:MAG: hypothetical protein ACI9J3_003370 [Parvicellaceae bacterium]